ncbi:MAG: hypothetical protein IPO98_02575 [Saprospiraceae bacterium]|nr:hypothetical protein [Saprospiraceae bacterium]
MLNKTDPTSSFTLTPGYLIRSAILIACHLLFYQIHSQTIYGENNYIEYSVGTLPLVISVPHGGNLSPDDIPTRTCNSPTTVTDANTVELGRLIDTAFMNLTGCHPHMIYCHLRRTKIDCNRPIGDGTCGNITAEKAWNEFQDFIIAAQKVPRIITKRRFFILTCTVTDTPFRGWSWAIYFQTTNWREQTLY